MQTKSKGAAGSVLWSPMAPQRSLPNMGVVLR